MKTEVPIAAGGTFVFGASDVLAGQADGDLKARTLAFFAVGNVLRLLSGRMPLADILARHGEGVRLYADLLENCCNVDPGLRGKLGEREHDARALANAEPLRPFEHTLALLDRLVADEDWDGLRAQAERLAVSPNAVVSLKARRMLALCLARSTERSDQEQAAAIYRDIEQNGAAEAADIAGLSTILFRLEDYSAAKAAVLSGIAAFPGSADGFTAIGQRIVEVTGDLRFRDRLSAPRAGRRGS